MNDPKKIESCLAMKENLEAVFNAVYDGIVSLDRELKVVTLNEAAQRFFDVSRGQVVGRECFCDDMLPDIRDVLQQTAKLKRPIKNYSIKFIDRTGDERAVILSTSILRDQTGDYSGVVLIVHDISEIRKLQRKLDDHPAYHKLIGRNPKMQEIYELIDKVSRSEAPALIEGESGVGKGLVAEAIHLKSARSEGPFIKVNCAALSESLLESELFGHVKGAYTGAFRDRIGRFELAQGGTIFLDEIGEIPLSTQVKLLTVLQDKVIERVGDTAPRKVDVRIISATNQNLKELIAKKLFREDLYYRLKVVRISLPPLRERVDDIKILIGHFIRKKREETGVAITGVSHDAMRLLTKYRWPGNVRELENAIAQAFVLCEGGEIMPEHLPEEIGHPAPHSPSETNIDHADENVEREQIIAALKQTAGQKSKAAALLGMDRTTLWRKMRLYNVKP